MMLNHHDLGMRKLVPQCQMQFRFGTLRNGPDEGHYIDLIARCADAGDVMTCVYFGRENKLPIAIRGGGHNGPGLGSVDDGLVIDMSQMKGITIDTLKRKVSDCSHRCAHLARRWPT